MCGWNEYDGYVSSPPRKYHYKVLSGTITRKAYSYGCGGDPLFTCIDVYSGRVTTVGGEYEPPRCDFLEPETGRITSNCQSTDVRSIIEPYSDMRDVTYTATTKTVACNGFCHDNGNGTNDLWTGTSTETLTEEDTEQMAEARALAAASAQDWTGPTSDSCKVASFRTDRGNTFSWSATQAQHRAQVPDYNPDNPDAEYEVDLWYAVTEGLMSARWVTEGFHTVTKKPTRQGDNWTEWVDIPIPEVGFFAWHMGCRVRVHNSGS
jgi:hypothetical protein